MIYLPTLMAILCVAMTTYATRVMGYLLLKNRRLSTQQKKLLQITPGCVLISVIAPYFATQHMADFIAIILTTFVAMRFALLPTVIISIVSTALLRMVLTGS
ncbi:AzlD domain-containing protein [Acinetobacter sp. B5B]|uniref:AzlD family protein n=1 Tax=Acinetobacter baretiae TaxID=2605383 RepID=UPI0018C2CD55|nr:AzlD domain-containing protein [Acinetobacter baretiae]MBF7682010.1 AzlD domain-containing protein [Acinetobacter baretiae]MBF7684745.1 AzlD domain-containing protein [Acinetobacter baretiae]